MTEAEFLGTVVDWNNHRPLLWLALNETTGPVVELGMGEGSTTQLHQFCAEHNRFLLSLDFDKSWAERYFNLRTINHQVQHVECWDRAPHLDQTWGVALVDHSPGERRWVDILLLAKRAQIIVIHDSEPASKGYFLDRIWHLFKYRADIQTKQAWATAVSNSIDVSRWAGKQLAGFTIS